MIKQTATGLDSRSDANPYNEDGFLPIITAPMYSVVNEENYQPFLDNKIQVCLPRKSGYIFKPNQPVFVSLSLQEFIETYIDLQQPLGSVDLVCIDTATGHLLKLHDAIRKAKEMHGDNLIIMAGNVASVEAFIELAKTGVDYIRVGIGGGGGCHTSSNTGVGQEDLEILVNSCHNIVNFCDCYPTIEEVRFRWYCNFNFTRDFHSQSDVDNISKVKIVADGISTYIKQCESKYGFNDNGYAAINKLLFAGADLVMIGKLFAQCVESAGTKRLSVNNEFDWKDGDYEKSIVEGWNKRMYYREKLEVKYSGMSTLAEQVKYKSSKHITQGVREVELKPSEGSVSWIPVRWSLKDWLLGSEDQDTYPYLMGWVNSIKSAMAYCNKINL